EILRDNEDLPFEERKRFLDALLQDNGRLESVVNRLLRTIENQAKRDRRHAKSLMRLGETIG
ncbi:MAG: hypothetical protein KIT00_07195, partial [Rhodospirillales bacterium]|nr:hypothetical protein [Rhodospirillales bacterium]